MMYKYAKRCDFLRSEPRLAFKGVEGFSGRKQLLDHCIQLYKPHNGSAGLMAQGL